MSKELTKTDWEALLIALAARPVPKTPAEQAAHYTLLGRVWEKARPEGTPT